MMPIDQGNLEQDAMPDSSVVDRERLLVLCVDDDPDVSTELSRSLNSYGIDVIRAFDGTQGYWMTVTEHPSAIIMDLGMPNGSGAEVIDCLLRNRCTAGIPIIVLTGNIEKHVKDQMLTLGVSGFLTKPATTEQVIWEIAHHVTLPEKFLKAVREEANLI